VVQIILWYLDSGCSKHMTRDRSHLINFVHKFLGMVKFRNDHVAKIMGYGDYKIRNATILRVYFMERLGHNLFSVGQFCDSDLEASKTKSWLWHRRLSHLNFGAINHLARQCLVRGLSKLKFEKDHICSACAMGKNDSSTTKGAGPSYPNRNGTEFVNQTLREYYEEVGISHETSVACSPQQNGVVERQNCTPTEVACTINDWDLLFQPMFDALLNPPPSVDPRAPKVIAPIVEVIPPVQAESIDSPSSTSVDQDAPSPSKSQTTPETQSSVISQDVGMIHYLVYLFQKLLLFNLYQRPVSIRLQLHEQALFCYYDAFLTSVEPKTYKDALTQSCWIEAMQEELNEFERLECTKPKRKRDEAWFKDKVLLVQAQANGQYTRPKRKRDEACFKDKVLLVQAQANGQVLHEEELEFLAEG
nr:hypothetical protein [Tanacetum cinerariifolium]